MLINTYWTGWGDSCTFLSRGMACLSAQAAAVAATLTCARAHTRAHHPWQSGSFHLFSLQERGRSCQNWTFSPGCSEFKLHAVYIKRIPPSEHKATFFCSLGQASTPIGVDQMWEPYNLPGYYHVGKSYLHIYIPQHHDTKFVLGKRGQTDDNTLQVVSYVEWAAGIFSSFVRLPTF